MKSKMYFKKIAAGITVMAVSASTILTAVPAAAEEGVQATGLTKEMLAENDYVLYTVNCGTPDPSVVPNTDSERMGLLQSVWTRSTGKTLGQGLSGDAIRQMSIRRQ